MQVVMIADGASEKDNPQRIRNRCDQRRWLAGKYNAHYSDKVALTDSDGGSIAGRLAKMSAAERAAWAADIAAQSAPCWRSRQLTVRIAEALQVTRVTGLARGRANTRGR